MAKFRDTIAQKLNNNNKAWYLTVASESLNTIYCSNKPQKHNKNLCIDILLPILFNLRIVL